MNTTEFLMIASAIVPDRAAIHFDDQTITYSDSHERVNSLANAMAAAPPCFSTKPKLITAAREIAVLSFCDKAINTGKARSLAILRRSKDAAA